MSIPNTRPRERRPIHPGAILRGDFLPEYELSVTALAEAAGVSRESMNELLRERRARNDLTARSRSWRYAATNSCAERELAQISWRDEALGRMAQLYADARVDAYTMSPMPSTIESPPYTAHFA